MVLSVDSPIELWILDSGASFHSSPMRELFHDFKAKKLGKVYLADDKTLDMHGERRFGSQDCERENFKTARC